MTKENLQLVTVMLAVLIGVLFVNNMVMTSRVTSKVIESLKRDYVPGPYNPGFDPDKVSPGVAK